MIILLWMLGLFIIWHLIGSIVLTYIDINEELKRWADKAIYGLDMFIPMVWPVILWFWWKQRVY